MDLLYKITCTINGKAYIGVTNHLSKRLSVHKTFALHRQSPFPFYRAIRKYGWDAFQVQILYSGDDARNLEAKFIKEQKTLVPNGYNVAEGGAGRPGKRSPMSEETKKKIGNANRERKATPAQLAALSLHRHDKWTQKRRFAFSQKMKGRSTPWLQGTKNHSARSYSINIPDGQLVTVNNLGGFCKTHNLNIRSVYTAIYKYGGYYKGYNIIYA